jgi:ABC-type dipeptide/oligopeptide/nickel transport system ATPase component
MESLLQVQDLTIYRSERDGRERRIIDNLSFGLAPGETVGLLGQSGSGKTSLALSLLRLLPKTARVVSKCMRFRDCDIAHADETALRKMRGAGVAIIFQEPALSLNPVMRVLDQIAEVARAHLPGNSRDFKRAAETALREVRLGESRIWSAYPHQLSAGQRQRVAIAQALVCRPTLVIADEPTSSLDNVTQMEILELFKDLKQRLGMALLFITHHPKLLIGLADRLLIMQHGRLIEEGPLAEVYQRPKHPHAHDLLRSTFPLPLAPVVRPE